MVNRWYMGARPVILMYHSVGVEGGFDNVSLHRFERHIEWMRGRCEVVNLRQLLSGGDCVRKKVAITFDDGLASFYSNAVPILKKYEVPATVFIMSAAVRRPSSIALDHIMRKRLNTPESLMTREQLEELKEEPLITIGSHSVTHPKLPEVKSESDLLYEVKGAKEIIEEELDISVDQFAYPHNRYDRRVHEIVSKHYAYAVQGNGGTMLINDSTDPCLIPRVSGARSLNEIKLIMCDIVRIGNRTIRKWV